MTQENADLRMAIAAMTSFQAAMPEEVKQALNDRVRIPGECVMAGKKGMKQRRPRTQAEKDVYALARIEQYIDSHVFKCEKCKAALNLKDIPSPVATLLAKRYDKLRATKTESVVTHKTSWIDSVMRVQSSNSASNAVQHDSHNPPVQDIPPTIQ